MGLKETSLRINSIGCPVCRDQYHVLLKEWLKPHLAHLCGNCQDRYARNPLRIIDCKEARCQTVTVNAPAQTDHLCPACQEHFAGLQHQLDILALPYTIDKRIVRGLDYYTRTVFEFVSDHVGTQGTICGGGRYDGLIEAVGGPATPGIGFALGVERLLMELAAQGVEMPAAPGSTLFIAIAGDHEDDARILCNRLRRFGIRCETDLLGRSLKAQMKYAGKSGARYVLVIGDDEVRNGTGRLRDLRDGQETEVVLVQLEKSLV